MTQLLNHLITTVVVEQPQPGFAGWLNTGRPLVSNGSLEYWGDFRGSGWLNIGFPDLLQYLAGSQHSTAPQGIRKFTQDNKKTKN